jgi:hypothetical protein
MLGGSDSLIKYSRLFNFPCLMDTKIWEASQTRPSTPTLCCHHVIIRGGQHLSTKSGIAPSPKGKL